MADYLSSIELDYTTIASLAGEDSQVKSIA